MDPSRASARFNRQMKRTSRTLKHFIDGLKTVKRVEILPYHTLGLFKWEKLGIKYPLEGVNPPSEEAVARAEKILGIEKVSQK